MSDKDIKAPYVYPSTAGTNRKVLIKLQGIQDPADAAKNEPTISTAASTKPVGNFTADMKGLKAVHAQYFGKVYEWAGKTSADTITIQCETIEQNPKLILTKPPDFRSGHAGLANHALPGHLMDYKTTDGLANLIADNTAIAERANDYVAEQGANQGAEQRTEATQAQASPDASKAPNLVRPRWRTV